MGHTWNPTGMEFFRETIYMIILSCCGAATSRTSLFSNEGNPVSMIITECNPDDAKY